jgi:hypothetical protein
MDSETPRSEGENIFEMVYLSYGIINALRDHYGIINEAMYNIEKHVKILYNDHGKKLAEVYKDNPKRIYEKVIKGEQEIVSHLKSGELLGEPFGEANKIMEVDIIFCFIRDASQYDPTNKRIIISPNFNHIELLGPEGLNNEELLAKHPSFSRCVSEQGIKLVITHELTHWLDDATKNNHLSNFKISNLKIPLQVTYPETNAVINAMDILKKELGQEKWDSISFIELLHIYDTLAAVYVHHLSNLTKEQYDEWQKKLFKRMEREKLLGKKMLPLPYNELKKL